MNLKHGQITISILSIIGGVILAGIGTLTYINSVTDAKVQPVAARVDTLENREQLTAIAVASMQADLKWVKDSLQARGFAPIQINMATGTNAQAMK